MEAALRSSDDPGFFVLEILLRLLGVVSSQDSLVGTLAVRCGRRGDDQLCRKAGLAARCSQSAWTKLAAISCRNRHSS